MSNPFPAHFDSNCNSCGDDIYQGDDCFAVDGQFVCRNCAESNGNVCPDCQNYKREEYDTCFECHEGMIDDNDKTYE